MDQTRITDLTRRGIREPSQVDVSNTDIANMTLAGVKYLSLKIRSYDPSFYRRRKSIFSRTNVFTRPSDCLTLERVWDLGQNAAAVTAASAATPVVVGTNTNHTITGATNATPIVVTVSAAHGFESGNEVFIGGCLGNTEANGTFDITKLSSTTFSLDDSTGNGAWTAGGIVNLTSLAHGLYSGDIAFFHSLVGMTVLNNTAWPIKRASLVLGTDDKLYKCIAAHTSAAATMPITGANYAVYWEEIDTGETVEPWVTGTAYVLSDYTLSCTGSVGTGIWTSGGYFFKEPEKPTKIERKNLQESMMDDQTGWFAREGYIVVDDPDFSNDIVVDYSARPTAITAIPEDFHMALVAYNVVHLIRLPKPDASDFQDKVESKRMHMELLAEQVEHIKETFNVSDENQDIPMGIDLEDYL